MKKYKRAFIHQQDQSDCGVACLASLVKYFGGHVSLEKLRESSGTNTQGTTLLGLYNAAPAVGLQAEAFQAEIKHLRELKKPCILHVVIDKQLQHYVISYGYTKGKFIISDPAKGVKLFSEEELGAIWVSKALLTTEPSEDFKKGNLVKNQKKKWIIDLIKEDVNILGVSLCLGIVIAIFGLATAVFSQKLIDEILPESHKIKLVIGIGLLFFLLLIRNGLSYIRQFFLIRQSKDFNNRIINFFYRSLLHLPKSFFDNRKTGELIARMNDTLRIQNAIIHITTNLLIDILLLIVITIFTFAYSFSIGLIALLFLPLYLVAVYFFHDNIVNKQRSVMSAYAKNESNYVDTIQGIGSIKASNKQKHFAGLTKSVYNTFQEKIYQLGETRIKFDFSIEVISAVLVTAILAVGALKVLNENLKLGEFMAVIQMVMLLMPSANRIALTNIQLQEARVAFDRMFEFTSIKPEYSPSEEDQKHAVHDFRHLKVKDIAFRFPGRKQIFKNFSFDVKKGEMIAIFGETGCGKSTTLQILQKFYDFEQGKISVNGWDWKEVSTPSWRKIIGVVPQQVKLFNGTVLDNICLGEYNAKEIEKVIGFCKKHGFEKYFSQFPQGYGTIIGEVGVNLSGGQQQLVALARALYQKPQLLLLDEATSAMDRKTELFILNLLNSLKKELGIILVTHKAKTARKADRIYIIENGSVSYSGSHDDLMNSKNSYAELWEEFLMVKGKGKIP